MDPALGKKMDWLALYTSLCVVEQIRKKNYSSQLDFNLTQAWKNLVNKVKGVDSKQIAWSFFKPLKIVLNQPWVKDFTS